MQSNGPVVITHSSRVEFRSEVNQRSYSLSIALPEYPVSEKGSPVLYVLDGDADFASAVEATRCGASDVVVVGIGYPHSDEYVQSVLARYQPVPEWAKEGPLLHTVQRLQRLYDLTLPASDEVLAGDFPPNCRIRAADVGGAEEFLKVIEREVKPRVARMAPIDPANQVIFGHSLGGLTVLHALFIEPGAFRTFVAASPSIFWNRKAVLAGEARLADAVRAGKASPRVLLTMGSEEQTPDPKIASKYGLDFAEYAARMQKHRMVDNARELTERLKALRGEGGFEVEDYTVFDKQDHGISPWPALGRAISFAFPL